MSELQIGVIIGLLVNINVTLYFIHWAILHGEKEGKE